MTKVTVTAPDNVEVKITVKKKGKVIIEKKGKGIIYAMGDTHN